MVSQRSADGRDWMVRRLPFGLGCDEAPGTAARGVRGLVSEKAIGRAQRWAARTLQSHHHKRTLLVFADSCAALALLAGYFTGALPYVVAAILLVAFVVTLPWLLRLAARLLLIAAALFFVLLVEFVFPFGVVAGRSSGSLPDWKALRWSVRGSRRSERVVRDVCDALWKGDAETFHPGDGSPPTIISP